MCKGSTDASKLSGHGLHPDRLSLSLLYSLICQASQSVSKSVGGVCHTIFLPFLQADRASRIEKTLQEAVVAVVSARCNCLFSLSSLSSGVFSCRGSRNVVAYRSFILGLNATALIGHVRDWVSTNTTIVIDWHLVDVYSACPVGLSKLYEPDCQLP